MTEVGIIPDEWKVVSIEQTANNFSYGIGAEASEYDGVNKYIRITDIDDELYTYNPSPLSSPAYYSDNYVLTDNDIVVARTGASVGKSYLYNKLDGKLIYAGFLMKFNVRNAIAKYVHLCITTSRYWSWVLQESARSGQPGINLQQLKSFKIPFPSLAEQQRIADALTDIDRLIEPINVEIEKKRLIKEGAMQALLTGKKRLPGFDSEWVEKQVGKIGYTYSGITGKGKDDFGHGEANYITFLNVLNNPVIDSSIFEKVDIRPTDGQNAAHKGDLFFNTSSETPEEVGICAVLNEEVENLYLNSFCFGYRLTDESVLGHYLAYFWRSKQGRDIMTTLAQGATRYNLSKAYFNKVLVVLPPTVEEQKAIVEVLDTMDAEISALESERDKYMLIKQGMMQELLTGKTRLV